MKNRLLKILTCLALVVFMAASVTLAFTVTSSAEGESTYVKVTAEPADWSGEYLIVYEGGSVAFDGSLTTLDAASNTQSVSMGENKITADSNYAFTITAVDGGYSIQSAGGYYIGQTSNANGLKSSTSTVFTNTISFNDDGSVNIVSGGAYLRYNATSGQYRFRYYKSSSYTSQQAIALYKLEESAPACTHTNTEDVLEVAATCTTPGTAAGVKCSGCGIVISGCETIAALDHDYISHDAQAATCTEVGWKAYETCSRCDYTTYVELPKIDHTYENGRCTVCGAKASNYVLVNFADIQNTDTIIIVATTKDGTSYALSSANGSSSAPVAVTVTISDGTIAVAEDSILWNIVKDTDGNMIIYPAGTIEKWLYCTNTNNGVRVGTNANKTFVIDDDSGYLKNTTTSRYLGVYTSNPDWRCYTTSTTTNIANQTFSFYKLANSESVATEPSVKGVALTLNKGVTVKVTLNIPEAWLTENAGAQVVFSNGKSFEAVAGENVYTVDLTPKEINDALTVEVQVGGTTLTTATDVSVTKYKEKVEALGNAEHASLIALLNAALTYSDAADGKEVTLEGSFADTVEDPTILHANEAAKLFAGYAGTLSTYASVKITVNTANIPESGDTLIITIGGNEFYNGDLAGYLTDGKLVIEGLYPANFDDFIYLDATIEGSVAEFTFNAYLKAVYESTADQTVKNLALATYQYGLAAEAYLAA